MGDTSNPADALELQHPHRLIQGHQGQDDYISTSGGLEGSAVPPEHAVSALPTWNQNKANVFKTFSTFSAFIIMGANDAAYGVSKALSDRKARSTC